MEVVLGDMYGYEIDVIMKLLSGSWWRWSTADFSKIVYLIIQTLSYSWKVLAMNVIICLLMSINFSITKHHIERSILYWLIIWMLRMRLIKHF